MGEFSHENARCLRIVIISFLANSPLFYGRIMPNLTKYKEKLKMYNEVKPLVINPIQMENDNTIRKEVKINQI